MKSFSCKCEERKKPIDKRDWIIIDYKCNYSYFQKPRGAWHPSKYSTLKCNNCHEIGRTKANYVDLLELIK